MTRLVGATLARLNGLLGSTFGGAGGGLPIGSVTGLAANVAAFLAAPSSANLAAALTDETGAGAAMFANGPTLGSVAYASLPAAGSAGRVYRVSNAGTKGSLWMDDGTRWKPLNGSALLASLGATSASIANTPTVVFQYLVPINLWQLKDKLRLFLSPTKSGTTDTCVMAVHIGALGTTGDQTVFSTTVLSAAQQNGGFIFDLRLETATTLLRLGRSDLGFGGATTSAPPGVVTITSAAANALYVSVAISSSGATNTVALQEGQLFLIGDAN